MNIEELAEFLPGDAAVRAPLFGKDDMQLDCLSNAFLWAGVMHSLISFTLSSLDPLDLAQVF